MAADPLPDDWRDRVGAMIRGASEADGAWFAGGPYLAPLDQIEVYRDQYRMRIWDALVEDVAGTLHLLGDEAEDVLWSYLHDHPPDTWTLAALAHRLEDWFVAREAPVAQIEMAWLDRAVQEAFVAPDGTVPTPADLDLAVRVGATLRLQPHVRLRRLTTNVHRVRMDVSNREPPRAVADGDFPLVVFRGSNLQVRHLELEPGAFAILSALAGGATLEAAVGAALGVDDDPAALPGRLAGWFAAFTERGLVAVEPLETP